MQLHKPLFCIINIISFIMQLGSYRILFQFKTFRYKKTIPPVYQAISKSNVTKKVNRYYACYEKNTESLLLKDLNTANISN